jgi:tetratricopeptide (TPR) repeat protein
MLEGRYDDALAESHHVLELEPATPLFHAVRVEILCYARKYDEAIDEASSAIKVYPDFVLPYYWIGYAYREKKMYPEARHVYRARQIAETDVPLWPTATCIAVVGNAAEARKALHVGKLGIQNMFRTYLAAIHVGLGRRTKLPPLNSAYRQRVTAHLSWVEHGRPAPLRPWLC